ncbi:MAG TPA: TonB-dependent receptor [Bryobacteraceae bacterium]|nr:TonB-dependent receptor [Bryobacteraceae bacterium]
MSFHRIIVLTALMGLPAVAQTTGTITGTVTDSTKASMPGVRVTATLKGLEETRGTVTNAAGQYALPFLAPGEYEISFQSAGFATSVAKVTLNVTDRIAVDAEMKPSAVSDRIEVTSGGSPLQTESATLGRVVEGDAIRELPLATRNFTQLLSLSAGTSSALNNAGALGRGTQIISASGARTTSNAIELDGVDAMNIHTNSATDNGVGSNGILVPSPEAVQEFKIQTSLYDAQSGRSGGANISLVTRSGSNQFHGSLFEFFRNRDLNANSFFFNATAQPRAVLNQNQYGGTIGGPIRKNRTFFFLSYQGTRQTDGLSSSTSLKLPNIPLVRTAATLGAAFAGGKASKGGLTVAADGSDVNPVALAILNLKLPNGNYVIPSPQISSSGVNYTDSEPSTYHDDQGIVNIDHQFSEANHLAFKGMIGNQPTSKPFGTANVPGFGSIQDFKGRLASLTDTHIFSSSLVNQARFGVSRVLGIVNPQAIFDLKDIGMSRFNSADYPDIPLITVTGAFAIGYDTNGDQGVFPTTWHYGDTLSWVKGKHNVRAGYEGRRYDDNYYSRNRYRGSLTIPTFADFLIGLPGTPLAQGGNGSGFSNIGTADVASGLPNGADRITDAGLFVQDDWKVSSRVTVNIGLRWDYLGWPVDKYGRRGNFDYTLYQPAPDGGSTSAGFVQTSNSPKPLPNLPLVSPTLLRNAPDKNVAPRFGLAYRITNRLVFRAGYGIFYDRLSNQLGLLTSQSAPDYLRSTLTSSGNIASSLQNPFPVLPQQSQYPVLPVLYSPNYIPAQPAIGLNSVDPNLRTPYLHQWGANFQYEVLKNLLLEVGYAGSKGVALPDRRAIDQALLASPTNAINGITTNTSANTSLRVPYIGFSPSGLLAEETAADSRYNSLQATVTRRYANGLRFLVSYTFSKSMDDTSGGSTSIFSEITGDESNIGSSKGPSDFDRPERVVANFGYQIPSFGFALNKTALGKRLFSGWEVSGVLVAQSGTPFSITDSGGGVFYGTTGSRASYAPGATLTTAQLSGSTESRLSEYFNTAAFTRPGNFFGNVGRNTMRGPFQRNVDFSVNKRIPMSERISAEFRSEFFNVLNMVSFASPNGSIASTSFGVITATEGNPRIVQFALKLLF